MFRDLLEQIAASIYPRLPDGNRTSSLPACRLESSWWLQMTVRHGRRRRIIHIYAYPDHLQLVLLDDDLRRDSTHYSYDDPNSLDSLMERATEHLLRPFE